MDPNTLTDAQHTALIDCVRGEDEDPSIWSDTLITVLCDRIRVQNQEIANLKIEIEALQYLLKKLEK